MTDDLRVTMLVTRSDVFGGAVVHVRDLALGLLRRGHHVEVLLGGEGPMVTWLRDAGIRTASVPSLVREISPRHDARALLTVGRRLAATRPDIVHAHTAKAGLLGRVVAAARDLPCVYTPHAWPFLDGVPGLRRGAYLRLEQLAGRLPASLINVCGNEQRVALSSGVGVPRRHFVVPNGVPDVASGRQGRASEHPPRVLVVARFEPQKDHPTLIAALARLSTRAWQVDLVGDGPLRASCERAVQRAGLGSRVRFLGEVDDVPDRLATAAILVLPSHWEAMPLVVLEAMRAGLPVIATDVGGVSEAVLDGVTGLLVPRQDVAAMADSLARLLGDAGLRARLGAEGRARYEAQFSIDAMVAETVRVYRTTLARHAMGRPGHLASVEAITGDRPVAAGSGRTP